MIKDKWLLILARIAEDVSPVGHAKIAAGIVYKNQLVSVGVCSYKTHPMQKMYGRNSLSIHLHAEVDAIIKAKKRGIPLNKSILYVARVKKPSQFANVFVTGMAKPCAGCMRAISDEGISEIKWTTG